jgi:hypothetical protein
MLRVHAATGVAIELSYASKILPSNDAFIATGSPLTYEIDYAADESRGQL